MANKFLRDDFDIGCRFGYHRQPDFDWNDYILRVDENDNSQVIGFELEVGCKHTISTEVYKKIVSLYPVIIEADASILNDARNRDYVDECEIITQPMTINYFNNTLNDLKKLLEYLKEQGFGSYDLGSCGLHIHFTRPSDEKLLKQVVSRLWLIQETYKEQIAKIDGRCWYHYAERLTGCNAVVNPEETKSLEWLEKTAFANAGTHSLAINLQHPNDIEIRSPRGTINFESLVSKVEFWHNAFTESLRDQRVQRITWNKLSKGKYLTRYCIEKDAVTYAILTDTTPKIKEYVTKLIKYNNAVLKACADFATIVASNRDIERRYKEYIISCLPMSYYFNEPTSIRTIKTLVDRAGQQAYSYMVPVADEVRNLYKKLSEMPIPTMQGSTQESEV